MKNIYTIGHSTRSIEDFITLLKSYKIQILIDVRTIPRSRHNPQYDEEVLKASLEKAQIHYQHLPKLGGLRHTTKSSMNLGWHNPSFRGFADYMQTPSFWQGVEELKTVATSSIMVIMCAEALPWRCHRSLIADALTVHKWQVFHIINKNEAQLHKLTSFLKVQQDQLIYPQE